MIIGIDFDNTIADYTGVFYQVARQLNWMPEIRDQSKKAVKQHFIERDSEAKWTELQGIVYGKEIFKARPYPNCLQAIKTLREAGHELRVISHKTRYPIIGEKVNFHDAARHWLAHFGFTRGSDAPLNNQDVFFNETKELKINVIAELKCEVFIDDLPSILNHEAFPESCKKVLFDPQNGESVENACQLHNWENLVELL